MLRRSHSTDAGGPVTNRRSLQTNMQRISRAQQFVPGHVGGRVASAQPVRTRTAVGVMSALPGVPPDRVDVSSIDLEFGASDFMLQPFAGASLAIVVVEATALPGELKTLPTPTGWVLLDTEDMPWGRVKWWAFATTSPAGADRHFAFTDPATGDYYSTQVHYTYLYGGSGGGTWALTRGTLYDGFTKSGYAEPPEGAAFWQQFAACSNTWAETANPGVAWTLGFGGNIALWAYPCSDLSGAAFQSQWINAAPLNEADDGVVDWTGLGAMGWPGSRAFAISWTP